jgi:hypothetical protein
MGRRLWHSPEGWTTSPEAQCKIAAPRDTVIAEPLLRNEKSGLQSMLGWQPDVRS